VLHKTIPFFADPTVGAVTGREELINLEKSLYTLSEGMYRKFYYALRLGESKINSTLIFQGELSLYRRSALHRFEDISGSSDDTGTVVNIISRGYRCIFVPAAVFHDTAAYSLRGRLMLKSRRGQHLISGIIKSFTLKLQGRFPLSSPVIFFNFYMHVVSPWLFLLTAIMLVALCIQTFWYLMPLLVLPFLFEKSRIFIISYLTSNIALMIGLIRHFGGKKEVAWHKVEEMRHQ
jgi:cellulose synthase/poly-beta-1,6-N-acetylglucosamine synthase-like glycosyltransferase